MTKQIDISWEEFEEACARVVRKIEENATPWEGVLAVTRGGLVPAAFIARALNIDVIETISVKSYGLENKRKSLIIHKYPSSHVLRTVGFRWLIVDDIADTGATLDLLSTMMINASAAAVFVKPTGKAYAHYHGVEIPQDVWVKFPWEKE